MIDPHAAAAFSAALFGLGILGVLVRRSVISVLLSLELMFCAAVVALVAFDQMVPRAGSGEDVIAGQGFAVLILTVVTAQTIVGLGLLVAARRNRDAGDPEDPGALQW
jgi:NADH-quinone oxidoreductase subunit K